MATPEAPTCYVGIARESAAFRLMKQMGWEEGEGLGKDKQGVGVDNPRDKWVYDTTQFDNILKKLKVQVANPIQKEVESGNDSPDNTPKKEDKPAKDEVTKVTRPQGRCERMKKVELPSGIRKFEYSMLVSQADDVNWWGHKYGFVSGGFLGATSRKNKRKDPANVRQTFAEEDQENLYNLVQDKATSGKQGLGIKNLPMKVGGQRWKGNKTSFGDSDEENSDQSGEFSEIEDDDDDEQSVNNAGSIDIAKNTVQELNVNVKPKTKVKKLCKRILRQVPSQSMKLKDLKVAVEEHSNSVFSSFSCRREALLFLKQKLQGSRKFNVEGKKVHLVS
ncbi:hypothetical protein PR202_ga27238 [Eleusine coracana subsp. coracana]|uniref:G-patch domain-containing protein n=1 Tax=Eleusine coracana subsp. coracana TaxID=191504 RepID=A0AAV5DEP9_ELECO|nr:hypothetical protein PR202_ga27238 [Eleusine coracana subsp. coracana]